MSEIYLVRHAQASYDAEDYDQLSELGYLQSEWLGEYFQQRGIRFNRVLSGSMKRHKQTAESALKAMALSAEIEEFPSLNEYDFDSIYRAYQQLSGHQGQGRKDSKRDFYRVLKKALYAWVDQTLDETLLTETWEEFQARINHVIQHVLERDTGNEKILIVSSGGAIATWAQLVLNAPAAAAVELNLQLPNTNFSHYFYKNQGIQLSGLNNIPHLDQPERLDTITYA